MDTFASVFASCCGVFGRGAEHTNLIAMSDSKNMEVSIAISSLFQIIEWAQKVMGREYLVDGQLTGKDMGSTRTPQKYGLASLDAVLGLD